MGNVERIPLVDVSVDIAGEVIEDMGLKRV